MSITFACICGQIIDVPDRAAGKRVRCTGCGDLVRVPATSEPGAVAAMMEAASHAPPTDPSPEQSAIGSDGQDKVWEYKVLTQKDKWFSAKFDPERLEQALNAYAKQGWRLRGMATATFPGFVGGNREELIFVLER